MRIEVVDARCPICGSESVRGKIEDEGTWWYVCDDHDAEHKIAIGSTVIDLDNRPLAWVRRFYFTLDGRLDTPRLGVIKRYDWRKFADYNLCRVCGNPVGPALATYARQRFEQQVCSSECKQKEGER